MPDLDQDACDEAINGALHAGIALKRMTGKAKSELLLKWHTLVIEAADDLAAIITAENGKTLTEARGEVTYAADFLHWFAGAAARTDGHVSSAMCRLWDYSNIRADNSSIKPCPPSHYHQATYRTRWYHHAVELPGGDDHEKSWCSRCRRMPMYSQASG